MPIVLQHGPNPSVVGLAAYSAGQGRGRKKKEEAYLALIDRERQRRAAMMQHQMGYMAQAGLAGARMLQDQGQFDAREKRLTAEEKAQEGRWGEDRKWRDKKWEEERDLRERELKRREERDAADVKQAVPPAGGAAYIAPERTPEQRGTALEMAYNEGMGSYGMPAQPELNAPLNMPAPGLELNAPLNMPTAPPLAASGLNPGPAVESPLVKFRNAYSQTMGQVQQKVQGLERQRMERERPQMLAEQAAGNAQEQRDIARHNSAMTGLQAIGDLIERNRAAVQGMKPYGFVEQSNLDSIVENTPGAGKVVAGLAARGDVESQRYVSGYLANNWQKQRAAEQAAIAPVGTVEERTATADANLLARGYERSPTGGLQPIGYVRPFVFRGKGSTVGA